VLARHSGYSMLKWAWVKLAAARRRSVVKAIFRNAHVL
jgi:hypothetical protein